MSSSKKSQDELLRQAREREEREGGPSSRFERTAGNPQPNKGAKTSSASTASSVPASKPSAETSLPPISAEATSQGPSALPYTIETRSSPPRTLSSARKPKSSAADGLTDNNAPLSSRSALSGSSSSLQSPSQASLSSPGQQSLQSRQTSPSHTRSSPHKSSKRSARKSGDSSTDTESGGDASDADGEERPLPSQTKAKRRRSVRSKRPPIDSGDASPTPRPTAAAAEDALPEDSSAQVRKRRGSNLLPPTAGSPKSKPIKKGSGSSDSITTLSISSLNFSAPAISSPSKTRKAPLSSRLEEIEDSGQISGEGSPLPPRTPLLRGSSALATTGGFDADVNCSGNITPRSQHNTATSQIDASLGEDDEDTAAWDYHEYSSQVMAMHLLRSSSLAIAAYTPSNASSLAFSLGADSDVSTAAITRPANPSVSSQMSSASPPPVRADGPPGRATSPSGVPVVVPASPPPASRHKPTRVRAPRRQIVMCDGEAPPKADPDVAVSAASISHLTIDYLFQLIATTTVSQDKVFLDTMALTHDYFINSTELLAVIVQLYHSISFPSSSSCSSPRGQRGPAIPELSVASALPQNNFVPGQVPSSPRGGGGARSPQSPRSPRVQGDAMRPSATESTDLKDAGASAGATQANSTGATGVSGSSSTQGAGASANAGTNAAGAAAASFAVAMSNVNSTGTSNSIGTAAPACVSFDVDAQESSHANNAIGAQNNASGSGFASPTSARLKARTRSPSDIASGSSSDIVSSRDRFDASSSTSTSALATNSSTTSNPTQEEIDAHRKRTGLINVLKKLIEMRFYTLRGSTPFVRLLNRFVLELLSSSREEEHKFGTYLRGGMKANAAFIREDSEAETATAAPAPVIKEKASSSHITSIRYKSASTRKSLDDYSAVEIARQITLIDFANWVQVPLSELAHAVFNSKNASTTCPHITTCTTRFNELAQWVSSTVVLASKKKHRVAVLTKFIQVMDELKRLQNFHTLMAFYSALNQPAILRLRKTWKNISSRVMVMWTTIAKFLDNSQDFKTYRDFVKSADPPCIPYIGFILGGLTFVEEFPTFIVEETIEERVERRKKRASGRPVNRTRDAVGRSSSAVIDNSTTSIISPTPSSTSAAAAAAAVASVTAPADNIAVNNGTSTKEILVSGAAAPSAASTSTARHHTPERERTERISPARNIHKLKSPQVSRIGRSNAAPATTTPSTNSASTQSQSMQQSSATVCNATTTAASSLENSDRSSDSSSNLIDTADTRDISSDTHGGIISDSAGADSEPFEQEDSMPMPKPRNTERDDNSAASSGADFTDVPTSPRFGRRSNYNPRIFDASETAYGATGRSNQGRLGGGYSRGAPAGGNSTASKRNAYQHHHHHIRRPSNHSDSEDLLSETGSDDYRSEDDQTKLRRVLEEPIPHPVVISSIEPSKTRPVGNGSSNTSASGSQSVAQSTQTSSSTTNGPRAVSGGDATGSNGMGSSIALNNANMSTNNLAAGATNGAGVGAPNSSAANSSVVTVGGQSPVVSPHQSPSASNRAAMARRNRQQQAAAAEDAGDAVLPLGQQMLNWRKMLMLAKSFADVLRFQRTRYELVVVKEIEKFVIDLRHHSWFLDADELASMSQNIEADSESSGSVRDTIRETIAGAVSQSPSEGKKKDKKKDKGKSKPTFADLMHDQILFSEFRKFLIAQYSHENLLFWEAVNKFKQVDLSQPQSKIKAMANEIYGMYITGSLAEGQFTIGFSHDIREFITKKMTANDFEPSMFDSALQEVEHSLLKPSFGQFLNETQR